MYYNYTEEEKAFLHITNSLLEEGYGIGEIVEFWNSEDEEQIEGILGSIAFSEDIDIENIELINICENLCEGKGNVARSAWNWAKSLAQKLKSGLKGTKPQQGPAQTVRQLPGSASKTSNTTAKAGRGVRTTVRNTKNKVGGMTKGQKIAAGTVVAGLGAGLLLPQSPPDVASNPDGDKPDSADNSDNGNKPGDGDNPGSGDNSGNGDTSGSNTKGINRAGKYWWQTYERRPNFDQSVRLRDYRNIRAHVEMVADYLISEGHADTFEEAEYIMNQLDEEYINHIINTVG